MGKRLELLVQLKIKNGQLHQTIGRFFYEIYFRVAELFPRR